MILSPLWGKLLELQVLFVSQSPFLAVIVPAIRLVAISRVKRVV
jgi:hypothetical protein